MLSALAFPAAFAFFHASIGPEPRFSIPGREALIVEFSPDDRRMFTGGDSGAEIRDVSTGRVLSIVARDVGFSGREQSPFSWPRFTPDGTRLIYELRTSPPSARDPSVELHAFDVEAGRELASIPRIGGINSGNAIDQFPESALSADGSTLAFVREPGFDAGKVVILDVRRGEAIAEFPGLPPLALSSDGKTVAHRVVEATPSQFAVRPTTAGAPSVTFKTTPTRTGTHGLTAAALSPDGRSLALAGNQGCEIRDAATGEFRAQFAQARRPRTIRFGADSRSLIIDLTRPGNSSTIIESWRDDGRSWQAEFRGFSARFSASSHRRALNASGIPVNSSSSGILSPRNNSDICIEDTESREEIARIADTEVREMALAPDGKILALTSIRREPYEIDPFIRFLGKLIPRASRPSGRAQFREAKEIKFFDASTGDGIAAIDRADRSPAQLAFSPDEKTLVVRYAPAPMTPGAQPAADLPVEFWDAIPKRPIGPITAYSALATLLPLAAGRWLDRRRALRPGRAEGNYPRDGRA